MSDEPVGDGIIDIEPEAREYIAACGGEVTLRGSRRHGCCGGTAFVPVVEPGAPREPERYRAMSVEGVTVFLEDDFRVGPVPLVIGVDGVWGLKRLRVEGIAIWV